MAAENGGHRYEAKLRHCHAINTIEMCTGVVVVYPYPPKPAGIPAGMGKVGGHWSE